MRVGVLASCDGAGPTFVAMYQQAIARGVVFGWVMLLVSFALVAFGLVTASAAKRGLAAMLSGVALVLHAGWWNGAEFEGCGEVHPLWCTTSTLLVALLALGPWFTARRGEWSAARLAALVAFTVVFGAGYVTEYGWFTPFEFLLVVPMACAVWSSTSGRVPRWCFRAVASPLVGLLLLAVVCEIVMAHSALSSVVVFDEFRRAGEFLRLAAAPADG